jgi:hypothetical protein
MKFNSNPLEFLKNRAEQSALKTIIQDTVKDFEHALTFVGKTDYQGPMQLRYMNMKIDKLVELHHAVASLRGDVKRIRERFPVSPDVAEIFKKMDEICEKITHSEEAQKIIDGWKSSDKQNELELVGDEAFNLANQMQNLWQEIHKLKKADFPSILSSKIKTNK